MEVKQCLSDFRERVLCAETHRGRIDTLSRIKERRKNSGLSCVDIQNEIDVEIKITTDLNSEREKICRFLNHLSGAKFEIMYAYYVRCLPTWDAVSENLHISIRCVYKWRKYAFDTLENFKEELS